MSTFRTRWPSPALAVSVIALVIALGGTSYAAFSLPKNSVGTKQVKDRAVVTGKINNGAITAIKLQNNSITTSKVKDGSLLAADFKPGQLPAGAQGPKGDKGDPGIQGAKGDKGDPGATHVQTRTGIGPSAGAGGYSNATASCQPGESLVGGGAFTNSPPPAQPTLTASAPDPNSASTWRVSYRNDGVGSLTAFAYALCASP
jgi:hypothetical protein